MKKAAGDKTMKVASSKKIFEYHDYRVFLRDLYESSKAKNKGFTYRYISGLAGFQTPSFLKHVIDGEKNLSSESAEKLSSAFGLNKEETDFFKNLVLFNQSTTVEERRVNLERLLKNRGYKAINPLKESQYRYFSKWYYVAVRELILMPGFNEDPQWIAGSIRPHITPEQAAEALRELEKLGLIARNSEGKLALTGGTVATPDELTSVSLAQCHRDFMRLASESIDTIQREKRDISSVTFRLSEQTAKKIKEMIQKFRRELAQVASEEASPDSIYQLNFQLFPLAEVKKEVK